MTEKLILVDGTELDECSCGFDGQYSLWCYLKGISFGEAFQHFSDPENFKTVIYEIDNVNVIHKLTYTGMTELSAIQKERDIVSVRLKGFNIQETEERLSKERDEDHGAIHNPDQNES